MLNSTNQIFKEANRGSSNSNSNAKIKSNPTLRKKEEINEGFLSVLRFNKLNLVEMGYVDIINPIEKELIILKDLCESKEMNIEEIIDFLEKTTVFDMLSRSYKYCEILAGSYQGFYVKNQSYVASLKEHYQAILFDQKENPKGLNFPGEITRLKLEICRNYKLWCHAFAIEFAYNKCSNDQNILTYSHRITGWSNPDYQLTPNFSVQLKTNFGYGSVSYFYTKLKYKNIEITPFSDWIHYRFANFNEIIRYSQSHLLHNSSWHEAMSFAKDACNLSLSNERGFVGKYIIGECEEMVSGLERILTTDEIQLKRSNEFYKQKFNGHELVVFRGEKITGALDFITKILQFEGIAQMSGFVKRIENSNRKLYPYLVSEINLLEEKISKATQERIILQPEYDVLKQINQEYKAKKQHLQSQMILSGKLDKTAPDLNVLEKAFNLAEPTYQEFSEKYRLIQNKNAELTITISTCSEYKNSISVSIKKVKAYFQ